MSYKKILKTLFKSKNRIVVNTAILGNYDDLCDPIYISSNCDYICFTDNPNLTSKIWKIKKIKLYNNDIVRTSRMAKILAHKFVEEYDISIWTDSNITLTKDVNVLIDKYLKNENMACFKHSIRDCIYQEAQECIILKKDDEDIILKQMELYKTENYPEHNGLIESGILLRRHNVPVIKEAMELWWYFIDNYSKRDQLSFNYVAWKRKLNYNEIEQSVYVNDFSQYHIHKSSNL